MKPGRWVADVLIDDPRCKNVSSDPSYSDYFFVLTVSEAIEMQSRFKSELYLGVNQDKLDELLQKSNVPGAKIVVSIEEWESGF